MLLQPEINPLGGIMEKNPKDRRQSKGLSNTWQSIVLIFIILGVGFSTAVMIQDAVIKEEQVVIIATTAAERVIHEYKKEDALIDSDDFMRGWINSKGVTMEEYIKEVYNYKTRVFKGGMLMVDNSFDSRDEMCEKYGDLVVNDLVDKLIRFED